MISTALMVRRGYSSLYGNAIAYRIIGHLNPLTGTQDDMAFIPLEKLHRLEEGYRRCFRIAGENILLLVCDNRTYLIADICPHAGAPLSRGILREACIRCPKHGIQFSLESGKAVGGEAVASIPPLRMYRAVYRDNEIGIDLEEKS